MSDKKLSTGNWFSDLLMNFVPNTVTIGGETPEEMVKNASWSAFTVSTLMALPPGPVGWLTILPEMIAVTKIQMNLIHKIAQFYFKSPSVNANLILLVFANGAGINFGKKFIARMGERTVIRAMGEQSVRPLARKVGVRLGEKVSQKLLGRLIPILLAPVFGAFSKSMTTKIGYEAIRVFRGDLEIIEGEIVEDTRPKVGIS